MACIHLGVFVEMPTSSMSSPPDHESGRAFDDASSEGVKRIRDWGALSVSGQERRLMSTTDRDGRLCHSRKLEWV